jgi:hypothetical protein
VKVQTGLELADHEIVVGIGLNTLDGETANPRVDLAGQALGLAVAGLEIEGLLAVESENLGRGHDIAAAEDGEAGILVRDFGGLLPGEVDRVVHDVVDGEVPDTENGGQSGAAESATTGNSLVLVESERQALAEELRNGVLDGGDTSAATNHLNLINVVNSELGLRKSLLQGNGDPVKKGLDHVFEILTLDDGVDIDIIHQGLDAHGSLGVGRKDLLELLSGSDGARVSLGVGANIDLVFLLELIGQTLSQGDIEVPTTEVTVACSGLDVQFAFAELNDGGSVVAGTDVDEDDAAGLFLGTGEIQLSDTPAESGGGSVVDEAESIETSNLSRINHGPTLDIGKPCGNTDGDIGHGHGGIKLLGGDVLDLGQEHGNQLSGRELLLLAEEVDLDTGLAIDVTDGGGVVLLLNLDIGVVERAADQALQRTDGVLQIRGLSCLGSLTDLSAARGESNQGTMYRILSQSFQIREYDGAEVAGEITYGVCRLETSLVICEMKKIEC